MKKIGKNKHIGIYAHHLGKEHWHRIKSLLPNFSCKVTLLTSLPVGKEEAGANVNIIRLPKPVYEKDPHQRNDTRTHVRRMNALFDFIYKDRPDLFYIDQSVEVATFVNLLGVPYVFARNKNSPLDNISANLAYEKSLFNIAHFVNEKEHEDFKRSPYYQKTKYHIKERSEINTKLICMYLEDEFCFHKRRGNIYALDGAS